MYRKRKKNKAKQKLKIKLKGEKNNGFILGEYCQDIHRCITRIFIIKIVK